MSLPSSVYVCLKWTSFSHLDIQAGRSNQQAWRTRNHFLGKYEVQGYSFPLGITGISWLGYNFTNLQTVLGITETEEFSSTCLWWPQGQTDSSRWDEDYRKWTLKRLVWPWAWPVGSGLGHKSLSHFSVKSCAWLGVEITSLSQDSPTGTIPWGFKVHQRLLCSPMKAGFMHTPARKPFCRHSPH